MVRAHVAAACAMCRPHIQLDPRCIFAGAPLPTWVDGEAMYDVQLEVSLVDGSTPLSLMALPDDDLLGSQVSLDPSGGSYGGVAAVEVDDETMERWRTVIESRKQHHDARFHRDLANTKAAVDLLDQLVGGGRGRRLAGDGAVEAGIRESVAEHDTAGRTMQLKQIRATADSLQLAMDVLRARSQLQREQQQQQPLHDKPSRPRSSSPAARSPPSAALPQADSPRAASTPRARVPVASSAEDSGPSVIRPWHHASHADCTTNTLLVTENLSDARIKRRVASAKARQSIVLDAALAEQSAALRELLDVNSELEAAEGVLRREILELRSENDRLEADAARMQSVGVLGSSGLLFLPRDPTEWSGWAHQIRRFGCGGAAETDQRLTKTTRGATQPAVTDSIFEASSFDVVATLQALPEFEDFLLEAETAYRSAMAALALACR